MKRYRLFLLLAVFIVLLSSCGAFVEFKTYSDDIAAVGGVKIVDNNGQTRIDQSYDYNYAYAADICVDFEEQNEALKYTFYNSSRYHWVFNTEAREYCLMPVK